MDNTGLLTATKKIVEELNELLKKYNEEGETLSQIDIDLLKGKTRNTYDLLMKLSSSSIDQVDEVLVDVVEMVTPPAIENTTKKGDANQEEFIEKPDESIINEAPIIEVDIEISVEDESGEATISLVETDSDIISENSADEIPEIVAEAEIISTEAKEILSETVEIDLFSENTIGEKFEEQKTVVEKISEEQKIESVGEKIQQDKISGLKNAIGINEKFYFINELFGGDMKLYNEAIENLDNLNDLDSAANLINEYKSQHNWIADNDAFIQLSDFVNRKYK